MGTESYATHIIKHINKELDKEILSISRMIARDSKINEIGMAKSMKQVFPENSTLFSMCLALDDRYDVWTETDHLIQIFEYNYTGENKFDAFLHIAYLVMNFCYETYYFINSLKDQIKTISVSLILIVK